MAKLTLDKDPAAPRITAETAAGWAVNLPDGPERRRLMFGHRARRQAVIRAGLPATDYTAADAWLCAEYAAALAAGQQ